MKGIRIRKYTIGGFVGSVNTEGVHWHERNGDRRFYIDDSASEIDSPLLKRTIQLVRQTEESQTFKLPEILTYWEGYKYYPNSENIDLIITYDKKIKDLALYKIPYDVIIINIYQYIKHYEKLARKLTRGFQEENDDPGTEREIQRDVERQEFNYLPALSTSGLFHELQHAIQYREKFDLSGNSEEDIIKKIKKQYGKDSLEDSDFEKWLDAQGLFYEDLERAEYAKNIYEQESFEVEEILKKSGFLKKLFKRGGILEKRYSFKDLFAK